MATTESSAVIRFINQVQAQPIFDSFHEPAANQVAQPAVAPKPMAPAMPATPMTAAPPVQTLPPLPVARVASPTLPLPDISFDEDPSVAPPMGHAGETVIVGHPKKQRRWPVYAFAAVGLLALAGGVGYVIGNGGSNPQTPGAAAGAVPALAQDETETEAAAAVAETDTQQAEPAVAETAGVASAPIITDVVPEQTFDAGFDIIVEPAGARVLLDGKDLGPAPLRIGRLASGAHVVDVTAPEGYQSQRVELDLVSGEREVVRVTLDPVEAEEVVAETETETEPAPVARKSSRSSRKASSSKRASKSAAKATTTKAVAKGGQGTLMLGSKPPCKIYIDGKDTGLLTPQRSIELSAGKHKVTLVNDEHKLRVSTTVTIEAGKTKRLIKDMSSRL